MSNFAKKPEKMEILSIRVKPETLEFLESVGQKTIVARNIIETAIANWSVYQNLGIKADEDIELG